mgnify:CR=1 FL=1
MYLRPPVIYLPFSLRIQAIAYFLLSPPLSVGYPPPPPSPLTNSINMLCIYIISSVRLYMGCVVWLYMG